MLNPEFSLKVDLFEDLVEGLIYLKVDPPTRKKFIKLFIDTFGRHEAYASDYRDDEDVEDYLMSNWPEEYK